MKSTSVRSNHGKRTIELPSCLTTRTIARYQLTYQSDKFATNQGDVIKDDTFPACVCQNIKWRNWSPVDRTHKRFGHATSGLSLSVELYFNFRLRAKSALKEAWASNGGYLNVKLKLSSRIKWNASFQSAIRSNRTTPQSTWHEVQCSACLQINLPHW